MSAHRRRVRLATKARADLRSIYVYGTAQWGEQQARGYRAAIDERLATLSRFPHLGHQDNDVAGVRWLRVGVHVIYYEVDEQSVTILRILHERMSVRGHLTEP